jgi:hypothetical protein
LIVIAGLASALGCVAYAAEVQGVLMDRACSAKFVAANDQKGAAGHTRACALMPNCAGSGYGVFTADGKFITFDADGNKKAEEALKASTAKDNLKVQVSGDQTGSTMKVASIKIM